MALSQVPTDQELRTAFSRKTAIDLNTQSVLTMLTDRSYEPEVQNAKEVVIQRPNWGGGAAGSQSSADYASAQRGRNAGWAAPTQVSSDKIVLDIGLEAQDGRALPYRDLREAPFALLAGAQSKVMKGLAARMDVDLYTFITGAQVTRPAAESGAGGSTNYGTRLTYAAEQKFTVGAGNTNTLTLVEASLYNKGTGKRLVKEAFVRANLKFERAAIWYADITGGGSIGRPFCLMPPELYTVLLADMEERQYHWDTLTEAILRSNALFGASPYRGTLHGFDIITSNRVPVPNAGGDFTIWFGTTQAITFAMQPPVTQLLSPETNQQRIETWFRQVVAYGFVAVNPPLLFEATLNTTDT